MIEANGLTKRYGPLTALHQLTLTVAPGEVFGLLGPNGAGKTTTLRLLAGLSQPSSGSVTVDGKNPWTEADTVRRSMGVLADKGALYDRLTVAENLQLFARLYGLPDTSAKQALESTGVADLAERRAGKLSKGQRQRVALARAIVHQPRLLFLDEPTAGLDPTASASFHGLIDRLRSEGVTVILCSHDMAEVDGLCQRVGFLNAGRLMACDSPSALKSEFGRRCMQATVETNEGIKQIEWELDDPEVDAKLESCRRMGRLVALHTKEASLGEVFIRLTGRELA